MRFMHIVQYACWPLVSFGLVAASVLPLRGQDDFERVAEVLQKRCLHCHNETDRKGDLSLQTGPSALNAGYIDPENPDASQLLVVVGGTGDMPTMPKDGEPLTAQELHWLRSWIVEGAAWPDGIKLEEQQVTSFDGWSLQPLVRPEVPVQDDPWVRTPIDAFILSELSRHGLSAAPEADRRTLIRRLAYDLTGLPPTPQQVEEFLDDPREDAYEQLVDRLLASKLYGERWARHWLDVVKYADTCGYDKDKLRPNAWPYRDYVIRSFNQDKAYSRFVQEQIAGDILFPGSPDGILGLGFIAAGPWDFIGHVEVPESKMDGKVARNLDRDDMLSNAMNTFCSMTIQCARCHNHKFDPVTQEHYYGMQSLFAALDRAERPYDLEPEALEKRQRLETQIRVVQEQLKRLQTELAEIGGAELEQLDKHVAQLESELAIDKPPQFGYHSQIAPTQNTEKWVELVLPTTRSLERIVLRPCHDDFNQIGSGFCFPVRFKVECQSSDGVWNILADHTQSDVPNPALTPFDIAFAAVETNRIRLTATRLAERKQDYALALAEVELFGSDRAVNLAVDAEIVAGDSIESPPRWSVKNLVDGKYAVAKNSSVATRLAEFQAARQELVVRIDRSEQGQRKRELRTRLTRLEESMAALPPGRMVYAATTHFKPQSNFKPTDGQLRPIHVLHRGDVQRPLQPAQPGLIPLGNDQDCTIDPSLSEAERRAVLANWLTRGDHPLVWRSIVNRVWQYHFGVGIVSTPNDFGRMGELPSHPNLLDWLATEFRSGNQSFKDLHRLILCSSVYRQSSTHDAHNARLDTSNRFLWRMNRRRLEAEEIRDSILAVGGVLDTQMGGPGFYLFSLEKPEHSPHYEYHKFDPSDEATHRRSIYRFVVRSQPDPWMTSLDCADSSQSTPRRSETLTALQALSLLNNRFMLVMSTRFADRLQETQTNLDFQVEQAFRLVTQRTPSPTEMRAMANYASQHGLPNLCRILFNLNEFLFLD